MSIVIQCLLCPVFSQTTTSKNIWDRLINIEKEDSVSFEQRLAKVTHLKTAFENAKLPQDSVYARILHRIGLYDCKINKDVPTNKTINFTIAAVALNSSGKKGFSESFCLNSYTNLGNFYKALKIYSSAYKYYDSALLISRKFPSKQITRVLLLLEMSQLLYKLGDYQRAIEKDNLAISEAWNTEEENKIPALLNQRAAAYITQDNFEAALQDVELADSLSTYAGNDWELANSLLAKAEISAHRKDFFAVEKLYKEAIRLRLASDHKRRNSQVADDYTNFGNFYLIERGQFGEAGKCYLKTLEFAREANDFERQSKGHVNLGILSFRRHRYKEAEEYYLQALMDLKIAGSNNFLLNPSASQLRYIGNKELVSVIFENKTEFLLQQFKETGNKKFLNACLQTALLADSVFSDIRHEQLGEYSRLYWRDWTRGFFENAMDACFLANDTRLAFFFMEKSRAVLLGDQLNGLGATAYLSENDSEQEKMLKIETISAHETLLSEIKGTRAFEVKQALFLQAQDKFEKYVAALEKKYPAYFHFKYADKSVTVPDLQQYLKKHEQSFVDYFMSDTMLYVLTVTPTGSQLIRNSKTSFGPASIALFNRYCRDKQLLINDYQTFASVSNKLYKSLFEGLSLKKGRVVICPDNFMVPFESLCKDVDGKQFLVNDYLFSYTYSARYLLLELNSSSARGTFVGYAPVSFESYSNLPALKQSRNALQQAAYQYKDSRVLIGEEANKKNFMRYMGEYRIINVFSHAQADTTETEPRLYMNDSLIRLSELPGLSNKPAVELLVLSACETNAGRNATGEGVYSLARGFASMGVPAVAATLWQADEQSIYSITTSFHHYLSQGLPKDQAMQKAKLDFIQQNSKSERSLPFFWANFVLIGDAEAVHLHTSYRWWWVAGIALFSAVIILIVKKLLIRYRVFV